MPQDRPKTLKLHDFLIRKTAVKTMQMEEVIEKVVSHEKREINNALRTLTQVEISGFGKLYLSPVKLRNKLKYLTGAIERDKAKLLLSPGDEGIIKALEWMKRDFKYLKTKVKYEDRSEGVSGGDKEQLPPSLPTQGED